MMAPGRSRSRPLKKIKKAACLLAAFWGSCVASQSFAVEKALLVHWEEAELTSLARGIGQELAEEPVTGSLAAPLAGSIGGDLFIAKGLNFSVSVVETDAKFNGSTGILSKIQLNHLVINIGQIQFLNSPTKVCRNVSISTGSHILPLKVDVVPEVGDGQLILSSTNIVLSSGSSTFHADNLGPCSAGINADLFAKKLGHQAAQALKFAIAEGLAERATDTIASHLGSINQGLGSIFKLPFLQPNAPMLGASVQLVPEAVIVGPKSIDISLGAEFSFATETHLETARQFLPMFQKQKRSSSWIGITDEFLNGAVIAANDQGIFSPTLNATTVPSMIDLLKANSVQSLAPDARQRFNGSEPVSIVFGKAPKISVIYQPNGPGGIPIIDMLLDNIDIQIAVGGRPYLSTVNTMQFRFTTEMDKESNKLSLKFFDAKSKVTAYKFSKDLYPRPRDRSFDRAGFTDYLKRFVAAHYVGPNLRSGLTLPSIEIGSYYVSWQRVRMIDQMLILETSIQSE